MHRKIDVRETYNLYLNNSKDIFIISFEFIGVYRYV